MRAAWPAATADVGADLGARLGRRRQHAGRRGRRSRALFKARRRRPDRRARRDRRRARRKPVYGRMYQTPFADRIRNEVGIATMAVGAIFEPDHVNSIIDGGARRPLRARPPASRGPVLDAACRRRARLRRRCRGRVQYLPGKAQLERNLARAAQMAGERPRGERMTAAQPLAGMHAVVTGGGRGIGRAIAARLAALGASLTLLGRDRRAGSRPPRPSCRAIATRSPATSATPPPCAPPSPRSPSAGAASRSSSTTPAWRSSAKFAATDARCGTRCCAST